MTPPSPPILEINKVGKDFGYRKALKEISFTLESGEMTVLLGRNGAGKTTLLRIVAGLSRASSGTIIFKGKRTNENPEALRTSIGMISHNSQFYGDLTARENLEFFSKLRKVKKLRDEVNAALKKTGLTQFENMPVNTFSSGMQKRLNIARLMVFQPEILLLDEPYSGLDLNSVGFFNDFLKRFKSEHGAILLVTHQLESCFGLSDNVIILEDGIINNRINSESVTIGMLQEQFRAIISG